MKQNLKKLLPIISLYNLMYKDNTQIIYSPLIDNMQNEFDKQDKAMEKFRIQLKHPELFKQLSPKEYGQSLIK